MWTRSILTLTALALTFRPLSAQQIVVNKDNKTIAITTNGHADALADTAVITVAFRNFGKDQDVTYADATKTSNAVIAALTAAGVAKDAIESTGQSIGEIEPGNEQQKARYAQGMRFTFWQSWRATVPAAAAANVLHIAITTGANESGAIQWQLKQEDTLLAEAAKKALEHAREIASSMAAGLGVKLGALVYASNQAPQTYATYGGSGMVSMSAGMPGGANRSLSPLAISPERITKSATVYAVFAIE
jgi:uncharacterized protein YggE